MGIPLIPFAKRGIPAPYLIKPLTEAEATCGKATLLAMGDLDVLIDLVRLHAPERMDLITKFEAMKVG